MKIEKWKSHVSPFILLPEFHKFLRWPYYYIPALKDHSVIVAEYEIEVLVNGRTGKMHGILKSVEIFLERVDVI